MKGKFTLQILEAIGETTGNLADVIQAIVESPNRGANFNEQRRKFAKFQAERLSKREKFKEFARQEKRCRNLLAWLEKDGIVKGSIVKRKKFFSLTKKGDQYKKTLIKRGLHELPLIKYYKQKSENLIVITFDIPETQRRKRAWLRATLKSLGLKMVQESVWLGYTQIPSELITDLRALKMIDFIEIFQIAKRGSLRKITNKP